MKAITINYQSEATYRGRFVLWLLEKGIPLHASLNPERRAWNLNSDDMMKFKIGSLGRTLGEFYKKERFEPIPKAERHDVFHVLLGYTTGVTDEAAMQFFLWGNGKPSFFTIGTCLITSVLFPNKLPYFIKEYRKGKAAKPIRDWNFKELLSENIESLRQKLFSKKERTGAKDLKVIRRIILVFMTLLILSGLTAFPLVTEVDWMIKNLEAFPVYFHSWIIDVYQAIHQTPSIVLYGTDWLAFAHIIISLFFIGVYQNPVRNKFIVNVGIAACLLIFPIAFICGPIRGIPFYHQVIDCCFGLFGLIPLIFIRCKIKHLEKQYSYKEYEGYYEDLNAL